MPSCSAAVGPGCFNPHPTRRLGATILPGDICWSIRSFNPHPTRRLGATPRGRRRQPGRYVSILTQPEGWVPRLDHFEGQLPVRGFNPHPTRRLGATGLLGQLLHSFFVSILTQPEGWVPLSPVLVSTEAWQFQSSPNPKVGCHTQLFLSLRTARRFNPHPTRRLGATPFCTEVTRLLTCFNPHPTRRLGATPLPPLSTRGRGHRFQSSPNLRRLGATRKHANQLELG